MYTVTFYRQDGAVLERYSSIKKIDTSDGIKIMLWKELQDDGTVSPRYDYMVILKTGYMVAKKVEE
jgi:hypothetical protein